jgi:hypothetical protein
VDSARRWFAVPGYSNAVLVRMAYHALVTFGRSLKRRPQGDDGDKDRHAYHHAGEKPEYAMAAMNIPRIKFVQCLHIILKVSKASLRSDLSCIAIAR